MHPTLFRLPDWLVPDFLAQGEVPVGTYAVFVIAAVATGVALFAMLAGRDGQSRADFVEMGLWAFIVALAAAKVFGVAVDFDPSDWREMLHRLLRYAGHFYAGFLAGVAYLVVALRRRRVPLGSGLDYLAPALAAAHALGRLGCFFGGCCWGRTCEQPWAVTFTDETLATGVPLGVPLHPTQLYEAGAELLILGVLLWSHLRRRSFPGATFLLYVVLYGVARFVIEEFRADPRGVLGGELSVSQAFAIVTVPLAFVALLRLRRRRPHSPERDAPRPAGMG